MFTVMLNYYRVLIHHCVTESEHVLGLLPLQCLFISNWKPWYPAGIEHHPLGNKSWDSLWGSVSINILTWSLSSCFFKMISTDLFTVLSPKCSLKRTRLLVTSSLIVNLISMGPSRSLADRIPRLPSKQETN